MGSTAGVSSTWISLFPIFYSSLSWSHNDWNGQEYYAIDVDESLVNIGSAIASELTGTDTSNLFQISKNTFEKLRSYYIEVGLMATEGPNPFTDAAERAGVGCGFHRYSPWRL